MPAHLREKGFLGPFLSHLGLGAACAFVGALTMWTIHSARAMFNTQVSG